MNFLFECGWCGEDNVLYGEQNGFWGATYRLPEEFDCWACGGTSTTPDGPWTPAE
ncbi:hypothetical protein ABZ837_34060 [Streptomyces sp. NPDC047197]|uniref:hypothetical protein n=1 Tax=Streptomyces sp. NPDC047197 TaxID=3155477 RepID=UPI0033F694EE